MKPKQESGYLHLPIDPYSLTDVIEPDLLGCGNNRSIEESNPANSTLGQKNTTSASAHHHTTPLNYLYMKYVVLGYSPVYAQQQIRKKLA